MVDNLRISISHSFKVLCTNLTLIFSLLGAACTHVPYHTINQIPASKCEHEADFFYPIEFNKEGLLVSEPQYNFLLEKLKDQEITQVFVFVHGWNQPPDKARNDYLDVICRFFLSSMPKRAASMKEILVIGVFWKSTLFAAYEDPLLLKWATYFPIQSRADTLARTGFRDFLSGIQAALAEDGQRRLGLTLIGHSFGARIIIKSLIEMISLSSKDAYAFLSRLNRLQLILLNAAVSQADISNHPFSDSVGPTHTLTNPQYRQPVIDDDERSVSLNHGHLYLDTDSLKLRLLWEPSITELAEALDVRLFNIYSEDDWAIRFLYPVGSLFSAGAVATGLGVSPLRIYSNWHPSGNVQSDNLGRLLKPIELDRTNVWSIDATATISSHTDIFNKSVASLISHLLSLGYDYDNRWANRLLYPSSGIGGIRLEAIEYSRALFQADFYLQRGEWSKAEAELSKLLASNNIFPGWRVSIGISGVQMLLGWETRYERRFSQSIYGDRHPLHFALGVVLMKQARWGAAKAEFQQALQDNPQDVVYKTFLEVSTRKGLQ